MMRFDIVTLFPEMPLLIEKFGITARASKLGLWQLKCWNPRDFVFDAHKTVDDRHSLEISKETDASTERVVL